MIPPVAQKLIPRLASPHDGEVVATARALVAALRAAGLDLQDLAHMANNGALSRDLNHVESPYAQRVRQTLKDLLVEDRLDEWSTEFAEGLLDRNLDELSVRQNACLDKILRRASARSPDWAA
jgi:hypothetical protein